MSIAERGTYIKLCEEGSLMFSIVGDALYLKGGKVYKEESPYIVLPKASYLVLDNIGLDQFEDFRRYHFYLLHSDEMNHLDIDYTDKLLELEKNIFLLISTESITGAVLLAYIEVDHMNASQKGCNTIAISQNVFRPSKNHIIISETYRRYAKFEMMSVEDRSKLSDMMMKISQNLYMMASQKNICGLILPASLFFHFSQKITIFDYTPKILYFELTDYINMLCWIDHWEDIDKSLEYIIQEINKDILNNVENLRVDYCLFHFENQEGFFYQVFEHLKSFLNRLIECSSYQVGNTYVEDYIEKVFLEEDKSKHILHDSTEDEDTADTVIVQNVEKFLQVGRGLQSGNDIILGESDKTVSRVHLKIYPHKNGAFIEDLSSMGTYVDGERIEKGIKKFVTDRNTIRLGKKDCVLELGSLKIQRFLEQNR